MDKEGAVLRSRETKLADRFSYPRKVVVCEVVECHNRTRSKDGLPRMQLFDCCLPVVRTIDVKHVNRIGMAWPCRALRVHKGDLVLNATPGQRYVALALWSVGWVVCDDLTLWVGERQRNRCPAGARPQLDHALSALGQLDEHCKIVGARRGDQAEPVARARCQATGTPLEPCNPYRQHAKLEQIP